MKQAKTRKVWSAAAAVLAFAGGAWAQSPIRPIGTLKVDGDSSLHKWSLSTSSVTMTFALAGGAPQSLSDAIKASKIKSMDVTIAVAGLKSGESGLDKNMLKAMNAEKYPNAVYRLDSYEVKKGGGEDAVAAKTVGRLTIAGKTKPVAIDVEFRLGPEGVAVKGRCALVMSDYGITPPTLMLGTIKVRDPVTIRFDLLLKPPDAAKKPGA